MSIAQQIQNVFHTKGHASSAVVQTLDNDTLQICCNNNDEKTVNTVMSMITGWKLKAETRTGGGVIKTFKAQ